jgi:hypothetical protein
VNKVNGSVANEIAVEGKKVDLQLVNSFASLTNMKLNNLDFV